MKPSDVADYAKREYRLAESGAYDRELREVTGGGEAGDVLDLGAGPGTWTRLFAEAGTGLSIWHDNSTAFLDLARKHLADLPNAALVLADLAALPYKEHSFDLCFCRLALYHSPDEIQTVREVARVLRPGGVFAIETHTWKRVVRRVPFSWKKPVHLAMPWISLAIGRKPGPTLYQPAGRLRRELLSAGFVVDLWRMREPDVLEVRARIPADRPQDSGSHASSRTGPTSKGRG